MVQESSLQIFLTLYHGQLLATFFYDYIVRNSVRLFFQNVGWNLVTNVIVGILFAIAIIWAVLGVWTKTRRNLIVTTVVLIIIFIVRLAVGIPSLMDRKGLGMFNRAQYTEELAVFVVQMFIHFSGIVATWMLAAKQTPTI